MFKAIEQYFKNEIPELTDGQLDLLRSKFIAKRLRKKEMLLQEGEVCNFKAFVVSGLVRKYSIAEDGAEHIVRFADAGEWITDHESYISGLSSTFNIDAIEACEIVLISLEDFLELKREIPLLDKFSGKLFASNAVLIQKRVLTSISANPEKKYLDFMSTYPRIFNRVPLHMVASFLGVSRETLTRVRQGLVTNSKV